MGLFAAGSWQGRAGLGGRRDSGGATIPRVVGVGGRRRGIGLLDGSAQAYGPWRFQAELGPFPSSLTHSSVEDLAAWQRAASEALDRVVPIVPSLRRWISDGSLVYRGAPGEAPSEGLESRWRATRSH
uniref:Uncharacterized protein n=1 Tax=Naja naja TaxID=35670 RepID=A0A8C7DYP7_NAJNA